VGRQIPDNSMNTDDRRPTTNVTHFGKFQMATFQQRIIRSTSCMHAHCISLFDGRLDWRLIS